MKIKWDTYLTYLVPFFTDRRGNSDFAPSSWLQSEACTGPQTSPWNYCVARVYWRFQQFHEICSWISNVSIVSCAMSKFHLNLTIAMFSNLLLWICSDVNIVEYYFVLIYYKMFIISIYVVKPLSDCIYYIIVTIITIIFIYFKQLSNTFGVREKKVSMWHFFHRD